MFGAIGSFDSEATTLGEEIEAYLPFVRSGRRVVCCGARAATPMPPSCELKRGKATLYQRPLFESDRLLFLSNDSIRDFKSRGTTDVSMTFSAALDVNCVSVLHRALSHEVGDDAALLLGEHVRQLESRGLTIDTYPFFFENSGRHRDDLDRPLLERLSGWLDQAPDESIDGRVDRWLAEPNRTVAEVVGPAYLLLLRACVIANTSDRRNDAENYHRLAQFMQRDMGALAARCFSIVCRMFSTHSYSFFKGLGSFLSDARRNLPIENLLPRCQNVAWDIAHIMMLELTVEPRADVEINVPILLTFDRSLAEMAAVNTISAIVMPSETDPVQAVVRLEDAAKEAIEPFLTLQAAIERKKIRESSEYDLQGLIAEAEADLSSLIACNR